MLRGADWREVARVVRREPHGGVQRLRDRRHAPLRPRRPVRAGEILRDHHATNSMSRWAIRGMKLNIAGASHGFFAAVAPGRTQRKRPRRGKPGPSTWKVRQPSGVKEDAKTIVAINRPYVQLYQGLEPARSRKPPVPAGLPSFLRRRDGEPCRRAS